MPNDILERQCWLSGMLLAGFDESGFGSSVSNLFTAGVIFPTGYDFSRLPGLNDSKKLTESKRFELEALIKQDALWWHCASATAQECDDNNVYWLRFKLAEQELNTNTSLPTNLIVYMDGNRPLQLNRYESKCLIKGDAHCNSIAAASIIAKAHKDHEMLLLDKEFPQYGWANNKGYLNKFHIEMIKKHGLTKYHRRKYCRNIKIGL